MMVGRNYRLEAKRTDESTLAVDSISKTSVSAGKPENLL